MNKSQKLVDNIFERGFFYMKSLCIKTNNLQAIDYLLNSLENLEIDDTYFSCKPFKHYTNIIIHYLGNDLDLFYSSISDLLTCLIFDNYEQEYLKKLSLQNYFYFDSIEINKVLEICEKILCDSDEFSFENRYNILFDNFYDFISSNNKLYLNGFLNFRNKKYFQYLIDTIDIAVNKFIIEREYLEFISLLKIYINTHSSSTGLVRLYYNSSKSTLFDENNNVIDVEDDSFDMKYLSDISFSSNDYILNALLTLIPKKIVVHLSDGSIDEFINTLSLIFENRITICK